MTAHRQAGHRFALAVALSVGLLTASAAGAAAQIVEPPPSPTDTPSAPGPQPTLTPTPTPTDTPTSSPTPTDTPTTSPPPTEPPTEPPTSAPPPPTEQPGSPVAPDLPTAWPIDHEAAAAFAAATTRLRQLTVQLEAQQRVLVGADGRVGLSAGHLTRAEAAVDPSVGRVRAIAAELASVNSLLGSAHLSVEGYVRRTYQEGPAGAWSAVLDADDPSDFADRATNLATISATRGHAVELLTALPRRIKVLDRAYDDAAAVARVARSEAKAAAESHLRLIAQIDKARTAIEPLELQVTAAIAAATAAIPADQALAVERRRESDRLATEIVAKSSALAASGGVVEGTGTFTRPATGVITSDYGWRQHPILGYQKLHTGIDYDGADGVVYAADDGVVILTVWSAAYGNVTVIDHGQSGGRYFASFYAHQAGYFVDEGDVVRKGQPIGAVGSTGMSTGPHLHFEVRLDGAPVDPRPFL